MVAHRCSARLSTNHPHLRSPSTNRSSVTVTANLDCKRTPARARPVLVSIWGLVQVARLTTLMVDPIAKVALAIASVIVF